MTIPPYLVIASFILFALGTFIGMNLTFALYFFRYYFHKTHHEQQHANQVHHYLEQVELHLQQLANQQPVIIKQAALNDSAYHLAQEMFAQGHAVEDLADRYGMSHNEAELLNALSGRITNSDDKNPLSVEQ